MHLLLMIIINNLMNKLLNLLVSPFLTLSMDMQALTVERVKYKCFEFSESIA